MGKNFSTQAGRAITVRLDLILYLCAGKGIWRFAGERGLQNASFQASSAGCVCVGSCAWFYHGNRQKQQVQESCIGLLVAE